jgi:hypothetical protein
MLGKWALKERTSGPAFNAIMLRRTTVSSEDAIDRSQQIYGPLGGKLNRSTLTWRMPHGGKVSFRYLDKVTDADEWQGRNITDVWIEEAGQYPIPAPIDKMFGVMRSAAGVPVQMVLTANPGGPGQNWIRDRFGLYPFPRRPKMITAEVNQGTIMCSVIPSRIQDNAIMLAADPGYVDRLYLVGSAELVRAWLEGDWSAIEGAFFGEWNESKHVLDPFAIPSDWTRFRSGDWGFATPFSIGWWAIVPDDYVHGGGVLPRGAMVRYREWYGASGPQVGLRLTSAEVAKGIVEASGAETFAYSVMDPSAFNHVSGPSIAEDFLTCPTPVVWKRGDNKRTAKEGAMGGWNAMRGRLRGVDYDPNVRGSGTPMIYCFRSCIGSIRTIPVLQHDLLKPEDLDTLAEDHAADDWRYACMSRPWMPTPKKPPPAVNTFVGHADGTIRSTLSIKELIKRQGRRR